MDKETEVVVATKEEREYFLPAEMLTIIFGFLDPRTLVLRCRLVCTFWKDTIESSDIWKTQIRHHAVSNSVVGQSVLRTAHNVYPWYVCHALCKNIFGINIFPNNLPGGRPRYWAVSQFHNTGGCVFSSQMEAFAEGFDPTPRELLEETTNSCMMASVGECSLSHTIDLYKLGFTKKIMEMQPPIHISDWFAVRYNFVAVYHISVSLFNSNCDPDNQHGLFHLKKRTQSMEWNKVIHTFRNYRPDVRYITFHHGIDIFFPPLLARLSDIDIDSQDPGSKIAGTKVVISLPEITVPEERSSQSP